LEQVSKSKPEGPLEEKVGMSEELVSGFLNRASFTGLVALYVCQLAYSKKLPFDLGKLWAQIGLFVGYPHGFLVACASFGLLDFNTMDGMWNVTEFNEMLPKDMRNLCIKQADRLAEENPQWPEFKSKSMKQLEEVDNYFEG